MTTAELTDADLTREIAAADTMQAELRARRTRIRGASERNALEQEIACIGYDAAPFRAEQYRRQLARKAAASKPLTMYACANCGCSRDNHFDVDPYDMGQAEQNANGHFNHCLDCGDCYEADFEEPKLRFICDCGSAFPHLTGLVEHRRKQERAEGR